MYVGLEDIGGPDSYAEVRYGDHGEDPNDIKVEEWHQWDICLQDFNDSGVNPADVNKLYIGFGDRDIPAPGGWGIVYFDDILLDSQACVAAVSQANFTSGHAASGTQGPQPSANPSASVVPEAPDGLLDTREVALADGRFKAKLRPAPRRAKG
jgi:hypothetical protein